MNAGETSHTTMKEGLSKNLLRITIGVIVVIIILSVLTTEYQGKWALRSNAKEGTPTNELFNVYGTPKYTYQGWNNLPEVYQELFGYPLDSEDIYYSYQKEGLPSYWSFVVSVDSKTQTIQRYVCWEAVAVKPKEHPAPTDNQ